MTLQKTKLAVLSKLLEDCVKQQKSIFEFGIYEIYGEDSCDSIHSPGFEPKLGIVKGSYENVVKYAVELDRFITYGRGVLIQKLPDINDIFDVDYYFSQEQIALRQKIAKLEQEINELKNKRAK